MQSAIRTWVKLAVEKTNENYKPQSHRGHLENYSPPI